MFISTYRPCASKEIGSVYKQHKRAFGAQKIDPCSQFIVDLKEFILNKQEENNIIIMSIDFNEEIRKPKFQDFLQECGLWNPILNTHGNNCPSTCQKMRKMSPLTL